MDSSTDLSDRVDRLEARFETRMDRLEGRMHRLEERLRTVEVKVGEISGKLDILTSQIVSRLPTWWRMPAVMGATITLLGALYAIAKRLGLG